MLNNYDTHVSHVNVGLIEINQIKDITIIITMIDDQR